MILFCLQKMQCPLIVVTAFFLLLSLSSSMTHANQQSDSCWINFHLQGEGMRRSGGYGD